MPYADVPVVEVDSRDACDFPNFLPKYLMDHRKELDGYPGAIKVGSIIVLLYHAFLL